MRPGAITRCLLATVLSQTVKAIGPEEAETTSWDTLASDNEVRSLDGTGER